MGICELTFVPGPAVAQVYSDDGVPWREACPKCLEAGPDCMVNRLRRNADGHRAIAEEMEEAAAEGFEDVPTLQELRLMERLA